MARHGSRRAGRWPVQLRYRIRLTSIQYVNREAWREARLERCPLHPSGGCSFARHGTYERLSPPGTRIARWYCREGHCTFSLLPDCFAARLQAVYAALHRLKGLMPDRFLACAPTLAGFRPCLGGEAVLLALREVAAMHLAVLPAPLGFAPRPARGGDPPGVFQHRVGPDPPPRGA